MGKTNYILKPDEGQGDYPYPTGYEAPEEPTYTPPETPGEDPNSIDNNPIGSGE